MLQGNTLRSSVHDIETFSPRVVDSETRTFLDVSFENHNFILLHKPLVP